MRQVAYEELRMKTGLFKTVAAGSLSLALVGASVVAIAAVTAEPAFAKSEKANGGNKGGNGASNKAGGKDKGNRGGGSAGKKAGGKTDKGGKKSSASSNRGDGKVFGGNGRKSESRTGGSGGNGKLFGFLPAHQPKGSTKKPDTPVKVVKPSPKPVSKPAKVDQGNSWKKRLDDGVLETHPSELGPWNSAKRSPQAVENMVRKYRETGSRTGAGGMIGYFVASYEDLNDSSETYFNALQADVTDGNISVGAAERLFAGDLTKDSFAEDLAFYEDNQDLGVMVSLGDDGVISCEGDADACASIVPQLQEDHDALAFLESDGGADTAEFGAIRSDAQATVEEANQSVRPNKSTDLTVQEVMLYDVKDLLDVEVKDDFVFEPAPDQPDAGLDGTSEIVELQPEVVENDVN